MKKIILFLIILIFLYGCSQNAIIVTGEVRSPRAFTHEEILSLENSEEIIFWHLLGASGCITGYAHDVVVYGDNIIDLYIPNAYQDDVFLVHNGDGFDLIGPNVTVRDVYKIEVVGYDYQ